MLIRDCYEVARQAATSPWDFPATEAGGDLDVPEHLASGGKRSHRGCWDLSQGITEEFSLQQQLFPVETRLNVRNMLVFQPHS